MSAEKRVYEHLTKYGSITNLEASKKYGISSLSPVISMIRKKHKLTIDTEFKDKKRTTFAYEKPVTTYKIT